MPALVVVPARPDDLPAIARLQFEACGEDAGFKTIFPKGPSPTSVQFAVTSMEDDMDNDPSAHFMMVRDGMNGDIVSFAVWYFHKAKSQDAIDAEMLKDEFPWPADANAGAGNKLQHNSVRKKHEVVGKWFGPGSPFACMSNQVCFCHIPG
jgi:hypothetical protein